MQRFWAYSRILLTGAPAPGATVTVYTPTGQVLLLADLFADNLDPPTPLANPFTSDVSGYLYFYAANGHYDVRLSGVPAGIPTPYTWADILLSDFGASGPGVAEITLGGSRETGPLPVSSPETFDFANFLPLGVFIPAAADLPVGASITAVIACQVPTGASAVVTIVDESSNVIATDPTPFTDDTQMVVHSFDVPAQVTARQLFAKLTLTDGTDLPGLLMIGKLTFSL